jgi:HSP20 family molecular chaperone IbpA
MFPFGEKDKGIRRPSLFGDFDTFFAGFDEFDKYAEQLFKAAQDGKAQSYVYGYRAYTGEDGKPVVEEFSNQPGFAGQGGGALQEPGGGKYCEPGGERLALPASSGLTADDAIEPYSDVILDGDKIKAVVELPGVEESRIRVDTKGRTVKVEADCGDRRYSTKIRAPAYLKEKPDKTTYKNGVLELTYSKAKNQKDPAVV